MHAKWGGIRGIRVGGRMNALVVAVVMLLSVLFAAGSLYVAILKLRQQAWSDAAIWIFAPLVVFGGLTMAAMGASAAAFLARLVGRGRRARHHGVQISQEPDLR
jgi:hypothetical protein